MDDFLRFFDKKKYNVRMRLEIYYSNIMDYCIKITHDINESDIICEVQSCDIELAFAEAHVALKKWLSENYGGY